MKLKIIALRHQFGISKKTNKAYDMKRIFRLAPLESISSESYNVFGGGSIAIETNIEESFFKECLDVFNALSDGVDSVDMDFEMGLDSFNQNIVVGFTDEYKQGLKKVNAGLFPPKKAA